MKDRLNFVIIISDTLRRDFLSCYNSEKDRVIGKKIDTRNIELFAKKSVVFDRAYSASFPTVPHRRDVFTGCYTATYTPWSPLSIYEPVLQVLLGQKGYISMMITDEAHILENGFHYDRGFDGFEWIRGQEGDRWKTSPGRCGFRKNSVNWRCKPDRTRNPERQEKCHMNWREQWRHESDTFPARTATATCEWLEDNYDNEQPFYLYVDFFDPHEPWDPPQWYVDKYDPGYDGEIITYPRYSKIAGYMTPDELKHSRSCYTAEVTLVDRWIGRIFQKIEDLGLLDNTMIILTTDHGFLLGDHGFIGKSLIHYSGVLNYLPLFEEINHIPLIIYHPDAEPGRRDAIVQPPDFLPTIMEIEGDPFLACHGESFKDVLLGEKTTHRDFALSFPYLGGDGIPITFVKDNWSAFIFSKQQYRSKFIDKAVDGYEKVQEPWENAKDQLFDLSKDPYQEHDISEDNEDLMLEFRNIMVHYLYELDTEEKFVKKWELNNK
ncbi:MAG: sulfatase [Promethearchaeota archaeon]